MPVQTITVLAPQVGGQDGISELARQVIDALAHDAGTYRVAVHSLGDAERPPTVSAVDFSASGGSRVRFAAAVIAAAREASAGDLVLPLHAHLLPLALPFVFRGATLASMIIGIDAWRRLSWLQRLAMRRARRTVAISRHSAERFAAANPEFASRDIRVCHPAVPSLPSAGAWQRVAPGFGLMVGRMSAKERYKGHDAVLEAWPDVVAAWPRARLVIAGDGDDRSRLEQKAADLGLSAVVTFPGRVGGDVLAALYRDAALFVMPSRDEGFGLVYLEAMSAGLPCIGCPGAAAEILAHNRTGVLVPYGDVPAVRDACVRLFADDQARVRLGAAAAADVATRFLPEHFQTCLRSAIGVEALAPC